MANASLIPVILPDANDGSSGVPGVAPFGHAAFILDEGNGHATFYEYGLYDAGQPGDCTVSQNSNRDFSND